jgi:hypothetical protein
METAPTIIETIVIGGVRYGNRTYDLRLFRRGDRRSWLGSRLTDRPNG